MPGGSSRRHEPDVPFPITREDAEAAVCQDVTHCILATGAAKAIGGECVVRFNEDALRVEIVWETLEPTQSGALATRRHNGFLEPAPLALKLFLLNDVNKRKMVRALKPGEVMELRVADHQSRWKQSRSAARRATENARKAELNERRELGLEPPAKPRAKRSSTPRLSAGSGGLRFTTRAA